MSLLSDIEKRFEGTAERVVSDAEKVARSQIAQQLLSAARTIVPLLPEGREASLFVTKLEEAEAWARKALATIEADVTPPAPAPAPAPVPEPAPVEAVNPGNLFTTTLQAVDSAAWPLAPFKTPDGRQLYTWAGSGPAPADGVTWSAWPGPVVAA